MIYHFKWDHDETLYKNRDLGSSDNLHTWAGIGQTDADPKVDLYAALGYDKWDWEPCTAASKNWKGNGRCVMKKGVAFLGGACMKYDQTSFTEYEKTPAETAMVNI